MANIWRRQPSGRITSADLRKKRAGGVSQLVADDFFEASAGPFNYTLTASGGSYALTGASATLTKTGGSTNYSITALGGSYSLTGASATVKLGKRVTASGGSYSVTGQQATVKLGKRITATGGSSSVTGASATVNLGKQLTATGGAYSIAGQQATVRLGRLLTATGGNYSLTGASASLNVSVGAVNYTLTALGGSYTISGGDAVASVSGGAVDPGAGSARRYYVRRGKKLHLFNSASDADAFIDAEAVANAAVARAQSSSRTARKKIRQREFKLDALPIQTIQMDWLAQLVDHFSIPVDLPGLVAQQDYEKVMQVMAWAADLQDEQDIELLLLGL
jgi:hypothetical protein